MDDCLNQSEDREDFTKGTRKASISLDRRVALMHHAERIAAEILRCSEKHELKFLVRAIDMLMPDCY